MPGKLRRHTYDLVEETYDSKVPVHNEAAFEHGIRFQVKVGSNIDEYLGDFEVRIKLGFSEIFKSSNEIMNVVYLAGVLLKTPLVSCI